MAIKKCAVCGRAFDCPPSSKKITCSKACSAVRKAQSHTDKHNAWSEDSRHKLSQQGQTENLSLGHQAALQSPNSGRFETNVNAKVWHLVDPEGNVYTVRNLNQWARENAMLFGKEPTDKDAAAISAGFRQLKRSAEGELKRKNGQPYSAYYYYGWSLIL